MVDLLSLARNHHVVLRNLIQSYNTCVLGADRVGYTASNKLQLSGLESELIAARTKYMGLVSTIVTTMPIDAPAVQKFSVESTCVLAEVHTCLENGTSTVNALIRRSHATCMTGWQQHGMDFYAVLAETINT